MYYWVLVHEGNIIIIIVKVEGRIMHESKYCVIAVTSLLLHETAVQ